ncbi:hypothetical protein KP509_01G020400 [Ceratopteris richardii]|uniref:Protein kinase domain-containing protein n=1 Tax=Ceratopteris richardii TaxID=49495 RepID=A0A8T2VMM1_CERRI|nr:hypothetical protein KP509_01G020400 [Ceratopteris richardii]
MQISNIGKRLLYYWSIITLLGTLKSLLAACVPPVGCSVALAHYNYEPGLGISLSDVALRFQASEAEIRWYSQLNSTGALDSAHPLRIPFVCGCYNNYLGHNFFYSVHPDDGLKDIATKKYQYLTTAQRMSLVNKKSDKAILPSEILLVPVNCSCGDPSINSSYGLFLTYISEQNDNAATLSKKFNISIDLLERFNADVNFGKLQENISIVFVPVQDGNGIYRPFDSMESGGSKNSAQLGIYIFIAVFVPVVLGGVFFCTCIYHRRKQRASVELVKYQTSGKPQIASPIAGAGTYANVTSETPSPSPPYLHLDTSVQFSYTELLDVTDNFSINRKIGQGGYGSVFYGKLHGQELAIKVMNMQATREFLSEINVLTCVHHKNLVRLIGFCTHDSLYLVYEYVANGNLTQHLKGKSLLPWEIRIRIALDAARGLEYMHEHTNPTYIHHDIKSSNILLDTDFHAKIADFGLTKYKASTTDSITTATRIVGTFGYMAPEYARFGRTSASSDVYAFGVVLFELISAKDAVVHSSIEESTTQGPRGDLYGLAALFEQVLDDIVNAKEMLRKLVDPALGDDYPIDSVYKMAILASCCTREEPSLRPSMSSVAVSLMTLLYSAQVVEAEHRVF